MRKNFFKPSVTETVLCRNCGEIVLFERDRCSLCGELINHQEQQTEAEIRATHTQAISVANTILAWNTALFGYLIAIVEFYIYGVGFSFFIIAIIYGVILEIIGFLPPYFTFKWLAIYGEILMKDQEYLYKKLLLTIFLYIWGIAHIINLCVIATEVIHVIT